MESAVSLSTKNIVWESGCFDATSVRVTAQRHGIRTDASTRYEKSLDPLLAGTTFPRVLEYMEFLGKSKNIVGISSYIDTSRIGNITLGISYAFIEKKIGLSLEKEKIHTILQRLGFKITPHKESINVIVPSWRASKDISIQEDIVEEIARVIGYDRVPPAPLPVGHPIIAKNIDIILRDITLSHFRGEKYHEIYTYSFTSESLDKKILFHDMESAIGIRNAFNEEYTHMRRSLAPRILLALSENIKHTPAFGFFEIGKVYGKNITPGLDSKLLQNIAIKHFPEKKMIAGSSIGSDITEVRKTLECYLEQILGYIPPLHTGSTLAFLHPGIS
jgi:phenylalanyl-tRNA synthetase beta chain